MKTILIAEDSEPDAELLMRSLRTAGVVNPVFWVSDGDETIEYLNGNGRYAERDKFPLPGILMLDLKMPRTDGFKVLEWIGTQRHLSEVVIIIVSGTKEMRELARAYQMGAQTFMSKPLDDVEMRALVKSFPIFSTAPPS